MDIVKGLIVKSKAGHDKNLFFIAVDFDDKYVYLVNGKTRPIEKPKKKKIIHVAVTKTVVPEHLLETNRKIRRVISDFNNAALG